MTGDRGTVQAQQQHDTQHKPGAWLLLQAVAADPECQHWTPAMLCAPLLQPPVLPCAPPPCRCAGVPKSCLRVSSQCKPCALLAHTHWCFASSSISCSAGHFFWLCILAGRALMHVLDTSGAADAHCLIATWLGGRQATGGATWTRYG